MPRYVALALLSAFCSGCLVAGALLVPAKIQTLPPQPTPSVRATPTPEPSHTPIPTPTVAVRDRIVGSWEYTAAIGTVSFTFRADGSVRRLIRLSNGGSDIVEGRYTVRGNVLEAILQGEEDTPLNDAVTFTPDGNEITWGTERLRRVT